MAQWILRSFGLRFGNDDAVALYDRFQEFLYEQYENQRKTMLIIDEAQNLSPAALEELRMLSNINTEKDLALQIVLVGQPEPTPTPTPEPTPTPVPVLVAVPVPQVAVPVPVVGVQPVPTPVPWALAEVAKPSAARTRSVRMRRFSVNGSRTV